MMEYEIVRDNVDSAGNGSGGNMGMLKEHKYDDDYGILPSNQNPKDGTRTLDSDSERRLLRLTAIASIVNGNITSSKPITLHDAINMARELVEQVVQGRATRIGKSNKRKWEDHQRNTNNNNPNNNNRNRNNYHQQQNRRQETARAYAAAPAEGRGYAGNLPRSYPLQDVTCYGCGEKGHYKDKCPKGKNQQNEGARVRAYVVVENPQHNPNVVADTFLLNDHYACILIDSGGEKSCVSSAFTPFIDIAPTALNTSYEVELADGKVVSTNNVLRSCTLVLLNHVFKIDLLPTRLGSFDVIVGMDWLSYHRAFIDCYENIVRIPLPNDEILEVQGERLEKDPGSLACIKVDEKKLDDIHVVRDFPEVFPNDLLGLPPVREIEFRINLILGASIVVKSPYRLAPSEMLELSNLLKELQEKGFIRPSQSLWGEPVLFVKKKDGLAGYYRRFIENFSKSAKPLTLLTQKNKTYVWGDKQKEAFRILKEKLCNALVLALPDGPDDFVVYCDASKPRVLRVCVMMQRGQSDSKELNMRQRRWIELLSDYECEIKYHLGKANVMADALSRKERLKPRRVRAMSITIYFGLTTKILEAQGEASKDLKALAE
ncbi:putative reverse transcriptase domain-containing protein [Tanacetum coccineum]